MGANRDDARVIVAYECAITDHAGEGLQEAMVEMDVRQLWDREQRVKQILSRLRIDDFNQRVGTLSGGQLKRVALAGVLLSECDLLILDEPTNHLDTEMTEWLEEYLTSSRSALLMVTHDRYFLDRVCSDILELEDRRLYHYRGNYSYYLAKRQERIDAAAAQRESDENRFRHELEWIRRQPQARATKAQARIDAFYDLKDRLQTTRTQRAVRLEVQAGRIGTKIFEAKDVCKSYGPKRILDRFNYNFARYEKLGIVGDNGCGKSTFLRLLMGLEQPDSGTIEVGESVRFGYYSQQGLEFDPSKRVIDIAHDIAREVDLGDGRRLSASQFLHHFLFLPEQQYNYVAKLSGGERKRLYLCTVLMRNPNFLVLDEPTNDLDIMTLGVLEEYLRAFRGCVIVVSHDRYFVDKVADHLLVFCGDGEIKDFAGNYSEYLVWKRDFEAARRAAAAAEEQRNRPAEEPRRAKPASKRLSFREQQEFTALDAEIPALESEKAELEALLSSGTLPHEELTRTAERIGTLIDEIDEKTMRWLELSERA